MSLRVGTALASLAAMYVAMGCKDNAVQCATALADTQRGIAQLCQLNTYRPSQFCRICVPNGFYSVDDSCTCGSLTFDTDYCYYAVDDAATPDLRNALDYAVQVCSNRSAKLPYSCAELDATADGAAVACPETNSDAEASTDDSTTAEASSSADDAAFDTGADDASPAASTDAGAADAPADAHDD
jgi:hypothetical protein